MIGDEIKIVRISYGTMDYCERCKELQLTQGCFALFALVIGRIKLKLCHRHLDELERRLATRTERVQ